MPSRARIRRVSSASLAGSFLNLVRAASNSGATRRIASWWMAADFANRSVKGNSASLARKVTAMIPYAMLPLLTCAYANIDSRITSTMLFQSSMQSSPSTLRTSHANEPAAPIRHDEEQPDRQCEQARIYERRHFQGHEAASGIGQRRGDEDGERPPAHRHHRE